MTFTSWCWLQGVMRKLWSKALGCVPTIQELWEVNAEQLYQHHKNSGVYLEYLTFNSSIGENIYTYFTLVYFQRPTMKEVPNSLQIRA